MGSPVLMVLRAGVSGIDGKDDALTTGHVICGNEIIQRELVKIVKAAA
jgi:myo-inositol-1(or 4)-monophosphatase